MKVPEDGSQENMPVPTPQQRISATTRNIQLALDTSKLSSLQRLELMIELTIDEAVEHGITDLEELMVYIGEEWVRDPPT